MTTPGGTRHRPTSHRPKLGAMSVSLLNDLMHNTLDPGYADAARRRERQRRDGIDPQAQRRATRVAQAFTATALLLVGLILGTAYRQTQQQAPQSDRARQALVRDVERETATSNQLQRHAETLSGQLASERDAVLVQSEAGDEAGATLRRLETESGLTAVEGPGITVVLGDSRPSRQTDPVTGQPVVVPADENGRILDRDIQSVVNALWAAGAEAISVDGERLASTTPIRAAGDAILVDLLPVQSPYRIEAIGNPDSLLPRFADSVTARRFDTFVSTYGIQFDVHHADALHLRAATESQPHYATPLGGHADSAPDRAPTTPRTSPPAPSTSDNDGPPPGTPGSGTPTSGGGR